MALEEEKPMVLPPPDPVQETSLIKSKERVQKHGEVFTPDWMVKKMLSYPEIQEKLKDIHATFLEMQIPVLIKELSAPQILKIA